MLKVNPLSEKDTLKPRNLTLSIKNQQNQISKENKNIQYITKIDTKIKWFSHKITFKRMIYSKTTAIFI